LVFTLLETPFEREIKLFFKKKPIFLPLFFFFFFFFVHAICRETDEDRSFPNVSKFIAEFMRNYSMFFKSSSSVWHNQYLATNETDALSWEPISAERLVKIYGTSGWQRLLHLNIIK